MSLEQQLEADMKTAMLAGDSTKVTTLRTLKGVLLNEKVATGTRDTGLDDATVTRLFAKEAKKRQESAELYEQGGSPERAAAELAEKKIIEAYLPTQLSEAAVAAIIDQTIADSGVSGPAAMGQIIGKVKAQTAGSADGAVIARLVKERLGS
jgi:uncharacterized protein YqeY